MWSDGWDVVARVHRDCWNTTLEPTDGFKKRLLKWENQIGDFQKATGEVFSDRLKCAIVLKITSTNQNVLASYGALRVALMNYLEAEDDGHGPVPMEVGAMKGKKGDRGKKGFGKGKFGKNLGKYDKSNEHSKRNDYGKGSEKGREKGKKDKGKGQGKDEKPAANSSFQDYYRTCEKWRHKASECWQGYVQAVEASSSASSVAPSAATTLAAAKTAALIQEFAGTRMDLWRDGWISGISHNWYRQSVGMSLCWTVDQCRQHVRYAWCSDISLNNEDKVHLQDIQQRRIPLHGSRVVPLELWGPEGCVECRVKFDD